MGGEEPLRGWGAPDAEFRPDSVLPQHQETLSRGSLASPQVKCGCPVRWAEALRAAMSGAWGCQLKDLWTLGHLFEAPEYTHILKECLGGKELGSRPGPVLDLLASFPHL